MEPAQNIHATPAIILADKSIIVAGGILVVLLHTLLNLTAVTTMQNVLKPVNRVFAQLYFSSAILGTFLLAMGAVFLLLPLASSHYLLNPGNINSSMLPSLVQYSSGGNFHCYQFGMALWGFGGLALCYVLHRSQLVPGFLSLLGLFGYSVFIAGTLLELFGYPLGIWFSIPGGLFEIVLSLWLLFKGFRQAA